MSIDVLALVRLTPERVAALTAAGYAVREGTRHASRIDALRDGGDTRQGRFDQRPQRSKTATRWRSSEARDRLRSRRRL